MHAHGHLGRRHLQTFKMIPLSLSLSTSIRTDIYLALFVSVPRSVFLCRSIYVAVSRVARKDFEELGSVASVLISFFSFCMPAW